MSQHLSLVSRSPARACVLTQATSIPLRSNRAEVSFVDLNNIHATVAALTGCQCSSDSEYPIWTSEVTLNCFLRIGHRSVVYIVLWLVNAIRSGEGSVLSKLEFRPSTRTEIVACSRVWVSWIGANGRMEDGQDYVMLGRCVRRAGE